ncbi:biotin synthase BioB [Candidatus Marinamargulisbacteria bacterium SCGC AG-439-L15]|nr:biotin synthase BioB [Candidatus Marinamargulisbacteria bacterium SCGC AG-439-L15]
MTNILALQKQIKDDNGISKQTALSILSSEIPLLELLTLSYSLRQQHFGQTVQVHIINNAQNGSCPEDCSYCVQAKTSTAPIDNYKLKTDEEILAEAKQAYEKGAFRYCMVSSGRGPLKKRIERLCGTIKKLKETYPMELCLSAGLLDEEMAAQLKEAGLDRLNHNLNTSETHYPKICTTHTFQDRVDTLVNAKKSGLNICSGIIVGMEETADDIIEVAFKLKELKAESIPVNFLMPIQGTAFETMPNLNPEYCLRVLCLFRIINPNAEIRIAAGREMHLRSMEVMALYPANSLFLDGYLNTKGAETKRVYQMIKDAGFTIESDQDLDTLINTEKDTPLKSNDPFMMKSVEDLRPALH